MNRFLVLRHVSRRRVFLAFGMLFGMSFGIPIPIPIPIRVAVGGGRGERVVAERGDLF